MLEGDGKALGAYLSCLAKEDSLLCLNSRGKTSRSSLMGCVIDCFE
jgi:hypothetical protein